MPDDAVERSLRRHNVLIEIEARLARLANTAIRPLLQSRWHRPLSGRLMLLDYTGGKTGHHYTFPIGYFGWDDGDVLAFSSQRKWPAAMRSARSVRVCICGIWYGVGPTVITDQESKADVLSEFARRNGPRAARGLLLGLPGARQPSRDELLLAASKTTIVRFGLSDPLGADPAF
jgi:hypothetical protein